MRGQRVLAVGLALLVALVMAIAPVMAQESGGRICVSAFHDTNGNGIREAIEPLLPDVVVNLQSDQMIIVASYLTDGQTEPHCFEGLDAGNYIVQFAGAGVQPTGQDSISVILAPGQTIPVEVQFGAVPADVAATQDAAPAATAGASTLAEDEATLIRLALAFGGAGIVMIVLALIGGIIFWTRYRRA